MMIVMTLNLTSAVSESVSCEMLRLAKFSLCLDKVVVDILTPPQRP